MGPLVHPTNRNRFTACPSVHHQWPEVITEEMSEETSLDHDQTGPKTSPEPHRRIADPHRRITINILEILELPVFAYHTYYTSKHMYNWMKWLRLLGGWHFIAATAIKPRKQRVSLQLMTSCCIKFAIISNGFTSPFGKKEKKNCHLYNTILSLYISYQDITRRVC